MINEIGKTEETFFFLRVASPSLRIADKIDTSSLLDELTLRIPISMTPCRNTDTRFRRDTPIRILERSASPARLFSLRTDFASRKLKISLFIQSRPYSGASLRAKSFVRPCRTVRQWVREKHSRRVLAFNSRTRTRAIMCVRVNCATYRGNHY